MDNLKKLYLMILDNFIWVLVLIFLIYGFSVIPRFFSFVNIINIIYHGAALSMMILAMGFVLLSGQLDLSLESTYAFGPSIGVLLMMKWIPVVPPLLGLLVTLLVGAGVGLVNGFIVVKLKINSLLATLATLIIIRGLVLFLIPQGFYNIKPNYLFLGEAKIPGTIIPVAIPISISIYILCNFIINNTSFGKKVKSTGSNSEAAYIAGVNINKTWIIVFTIAGLLSSFGGILLVGRIGSLLNLMGEGDILLVFAGAVLGGISLSGGQGKLINALGGTVLLMVIATLLNLSGISPFLVRAFQGIILLVAILLGNLREIFYKSIMKKL
jgi:ribose/xylose/arabinose/galactoside ABC-type transport system permease subunit